MLTLLAKLGLLAGFVGLYVTPQHNAAFWPLAYVCLVPLALALLWRPRRYDLLLAALAFFWMFAGVTIWLRRFSDAAWLSIPPLYTYPLLGMAWLLRRIHRRRSLPLTLTLPLLFTAGEYLRVRLSPGQMWIGLLGYSQVNLTHLIQIVDVTGVFGVTLLAAMWNGWLLDVGYAWRRVAGSRRSVALSGLVALLLTTGVLAYGVARDRAQGWQPGPRLAIVQPNLPHYQPYQLESNREVFDLELIFTLSKVPPGAADMILWPENSLLDVFEDGDTYNERYHRDVTWLTTSLGAGLLLDSGEFPRGSDGWTYHTVFQLSPKGEVLGKSRKVFLLPWTEYVPMARALDWVFLGGAWRRFVARVVGFLPRGVSGKLDEAHIFTIDYDRGHEARFGVTSCFESANPALTRLYARRGADFVVNVVSEGLLGPSAFRQSLVINAFRAVEVRLPVVRATNTGISAFIDTNGRVQSALRGKKGKLVLDEGVLIDRPMLDPRAGKTFYARHGDVLALITCVLSLLLLGATSLRRSSPG